MLDSGNRRIVLALGRRDTPTDGVYDYCSCLVKACGSLGSSVDMLEIGWTNGGWLPAAIRLMRGLKSNTPCWAIFQVTHLSWSRRGFPFGLLIIAITARLSGARVGAIVHDPTGFPGDGLLTRLKRAAQHFTLRILRRIASCVFVTVPLERIPWLGNGTRGHITFLPVGTNVPIRSAPTPRRSPNPFTVVTFGVTKGPHGDGERRTIAATLEKIARALGPVKLLAFGRGTDPADGAWPQPPGEVEISALGILRDPEASAALAEADAMLFVRGGISSRRGSAIAGIAHGLPVVAYRGPETGWPVTEAGVVLVDPGDVDALAAALVRIATDSSHRNSLRARSNNAYLRYFAWDVIACTFLETLACTQ